MLRFIKLLSKQKLQFGKSMRGGTLACIDEKFSKPTKRNPEFLTHQKFGTNSLFISYP